jgi:hypothetical protein
MKWKKIVENGCIMSVCLLRNFYGIWYGGSWLKMFECRVDPCWASVFLKLRRHDITKLTPWCKLLLEKLVVAHAAYVAEYVFLLFYSQQCATGPHPKLLAPSHIPAAYIIFTQIVSSVLSRGFPCGLFPSDLHFIYVSHATHACLLPSLSHLVAFFILNSHAASSSHQLLPLP